MTVPLAAGADRDGPAGYSYAALLLRPAAAAADTVVAELRRIRFSGWVAPPEGGWLPVVAAGAGVVAARRRGVAGVGLHLSSVTDGPVVAVRVLDDRQLALVAWDGGEERMRYVSDPSREPGAEDDVLSDPVGEEGADALAEVCGRPEVAEELGDLLGEAHDPEEDIESERLGAVLRLLGLPSWLVTAWRLPRPMAVGPARRDLLRLDAGRTGPAGWVAGPGARLARRWRRPPPVLADAPRGGHDGLDDPTLWM